MNHLAWTRFGAALEWYRHLGYEYLDVPWIVPNHYVRETLPAHVPAHKVIDETSGIPCIGSLLGSGEQSLLREFRENRMERGKRYMTITPCFRFEPTYSELSRPSFMKLELFVPSDDKTSVVDVCDHAKKFLGRWAPGVLTVNTLEGLDLMYNGVEIGSYGHRNHEYIYGTGLAEPRFTLSTLRRNAPASPPSGSRNEPPDDVQLR